MLKFILFLSSFWAFITISAQQVTNMQVTQEGDNVVITYNISSDKVEQTFDIKVECSADDGKTFSIIPQSLTGDLKGVSAGTAKRIVWDVLSERETLTGDHFVFQLVATENKPADSFYGNSGTFTDDRDEHVYKWVKIGSQIWMAENLKATKYRNSDPIPDVTDNKKWARLKSDAYCNYNNDPSNVTSYGRLYNWYSVNDIRNIAPIGWHIPTDKEWTMLTDFLGGERFVAGKLKEMGFTFAVLLGGSRDSNGIFCDILINSSWWSSKEYSNTNAYYRTLTNTFSSVYSFTHNKSCGFSVRCVKD
jgi:uncharacterized protein (TIGR02145 family)